MNQTIWPIIENCPVIAAIKDMEGLTQCLTSEIQIVFVLFGDVCNIGDIVAMLKRANRITFVHIDLIAGLSGKEVALDFIKNTTQADGIITTKQGLIKHAKELGLLTILRYFVIDSMALLNIEKQSSSVNPDLIEILPGVMPKIIKRVNRFSHVPVIAGGLISDKEDVLSALNSGAIAISTTNSSMWFV